MKNKFFAWMIILVFVAGLPGCASVQKKFTRKKKEARYIPKAVYFHEGAYQKKYSNDYYYKTHYTLWKTWHTELVNQLGGNQKKVARSAQEALGHLTEMHRYLVPEKQSELAPTLESLAAMTRRLEGRTYAESEIGPVRVELEKIQRLVANNYYYDKIKDQILQDTVDLEAEGESAPQQTP